MPTDTHPWYDGVDPWERSAMMKKVGDFAERYRDVKPTMSAEEFRNKYSPASAGSFEVGSRGDGKLPEELDSGSLRPEVPQLPASWSRRARVARS